MTGADLSIVVPVYNERASVEKTCDSLKRVRDAADAQIEIIFVDDGSDDGTGALLDELAGDGIEVVHHAENRGYGAALKTGIDASSSGTVAITDADGTYPNERFGELLKLMRDGGFDMVVGARTGPNAHVPLVRRPAKWVLGVLANFLSGRKIPDLNSGMRLMKKGVVSRFRRILPDGFSFTTTITLAMLTNGFAVKFVPIEYHPRKGKSKIRPVYDTLNFLQLICRTTLYFNPLRVFLPLAAGLVALALVVLAGSWLFLDKIMDVSFGVILMAAFVVVAIGLLADLIDKRTPM
jgi:glycosyltransferase involved in cell wall biosynthesis